MWQPQSGRITAGQITVGTTAIRVISYDPGRIAVSITNESANTVYLGPPGVTPTSGWALPTNSSVTWWTMAEIWVVSAAGGETISYAEELR